MSVYIRQNSSDQSYTKNTWCILNPIEQSIKEKIERIGTPLKDWNISINYRIKTGLNEAFIIDGAKKEELIAKDPKSVEIIRPILRGRDIKRYSYDFADKWLIYVPWHFPLHNDETIQGCSEKAEILFKKEYPAIYEHLYKYKDDLSKRNQAETGMRNGANLLNEGYQKQFNTEHAQLQRLKNLSQVLSIELGEALSPLFGKLLDFGQTCLTLFMKLPPSAKSFIAISTAGLGVLATGIGVACLAGSKLLSFYGGFIEKARTLTPLLVQNSAKILENLGLNSTAHNITYGFKIAQNGDKMGLGSAFSIKNGIFADIRRLDKNLKEGIVRSFKELPNNISRSVSALKDWSVNSIKAIPNTVITGLNGFKNAFLGIPGMIQKAIISFRAFSITLLTSPIGWIALAIGAVVFAIYKYWKPITAFFKGLWNGLKAGLEPLMPVFKRMAVALEPIIKPIRSIIDWFKKLFKPVEDTGGKAEQMGVKFGKAIAGIIVKFVELIAKVVEFGAKIGSMLAGGIIKSFEKVKKAIGGLTQIIRDHLPHSPAKTGPLKDLHKLKIVETIASTIKPTPLVTAMNKSLGLMTSSFKANVGRIGTMGGASFVINYSPTITVPNGSTKDEFAKLLKQHKDEVLSLVKREFERKERVAY